jgi:tryptophanyl-tRNA synthetase
MADTRDIVLSGIQPTGSLHLGNYFGAVQNWVRLQDTHRCVYGVVDLHAMTAPFDPRQLRANTREMYIDLLACGVDPDKAILFVQSLIPEHSELCWILSCFCGYGLLSRMTQFKDKTEQIESKSEESVSTGLFTYPVLQAADILIYRTKFVPVGRDQMQHLELSRDLDGKFNRFAKAEVFPEPRALLTEIPKLVSLADPTKKMGKSLGPTHYIGLFEDEKGVRAKVKSAVTDTGAASDSADMSPGVSNLVALLRAAEKVDIAEQFTKDHAAGIRKYAPLKAAVADALVALTAQFRERRAAVASDAAKLDALMREQSARARELACATMKVVREVTGLPPA